MGTVSRLTGFPSLLQQSAPGVCGDEGALSETTRSSELHRGDQSDLSQGKDWHILHGVYNNMWGRDAFFQLVQDVYDRVV